MILPQMARSALVSAGSPDPAAKSSTTESGVSAAAKSSASVIAVFQRAEHSVRWLLTHARAAASHGFPFVNLVYTASFYGGRPQTARVRVVSLLARYSLQSAKCVRFYNRSFANANKNHP